VGCASEYAFVDANANGNPGTIYILQYPSYVNLCNGCEGGTGCPNAAWHDRTTNGNIYIALPGTANYAQLSQFLAHEYVEILTAPHSTPHSGWYNPRLYQGEPNVGEIADMCQNATNPFPTITVQTIPTGNAPVVTSQLPAIWSNAANQGRGACVYSTAKGSNTFFVGTGSSSGQLMYSKDEASYANDLGYSLENNGVYYAYTSAPSAVSWGEGHIDALAFDSNHHITEKYSYDNGNTFSWWDWGGVPSGYSTFVNRPEVTSWGNHRLDIFAEAQGSCSMWWCPPPHLFHLSWDNGNQSAWQDLGSPPNAWIASAPAAVSMSYSQVDVFVMDTSGVLWQLTSTDGVNFGNWKPISPPSGVTFRGDPDAGSFMPGRIDVGIIDSWGNYWNYTEDTSVYQPGGWFGWWSWSPPSGYVFTGSPSVTGMGDRRQLVTATTVSGQIAYGLYDWQNPSSWNISPQFSPYGSAISVSAY
jgi:hypothetical protein